MNRFNPGCCGCGGVGIALPCIPGCTIDPERDLLLTVTGSDPYTLTLAYDEVGVLDTFTGDTHGPGWFGCRLYPSGARFEDCFTGAVEMEDMPTTVGFMPLGEDPPNCALVLGSQWGTVTECPIGTTCLRTAEEVPNCDSTSGCFLAGFGVIGYMTPVSCSPLLLTATIAGNTYSLAYA